MTRTFASTIGQVLGTCVGICEGLYIHFRDNHQRSPRDAARRSAYALSKFAGTVFDAGGLLGAEIRKLAPARAILHWKGIVCMFTAVDDCEVRVCSAIPQIRITCSRADIQDAIEMRNSTLEHGQWLLVDADDDDDEILGFTMTVSGKPGHAAAKAFAGIGVHVAQEVHEMRRKLLKSGLAA